MPAGPDDNTLNARCDGGRAGSIGTLIEASPLVHRNGTPPWSSERWKPDCSTPLQLRRRRAQGSAGSGPAGAPACRSTSGWLRIDEEQAQAIRTTMEPDGGTMRAPAGLTRQRLRGGDDAIVHPDSQRDGLTAARAGVRLDPAGPPVPAARERRGRRLRAPAAGPTAGASPEPISNDGQRRERAAHQALGSRHTSCRPGIRSKERQLPRNRRLQAGRDPMPPRTRAHASHRPHRCAPVCLAGARRAQATGRRARCHRQATGS